MNTLQHIQHKLQGFLRKYYTNELLRGVFLFLAIGLVYFILTVLLEYFLWLGTTGRLLLFWLFVGVELFLFVTFIIVPLLYLFNIRKGIDYQKASKIIGAHFPEVNDKLLNFMQLAKNTQQSDLLLASIEQKGDQLRPIPFQLAINFKKNLKYAWYTAVPVFFILIVIVIGKSNLFTDSYKRVVDYKTAYQPPAPFEFFVVNDSLQAIKGRPFVLQINTAGNVVPENVHIEIDGTTYLMQQKQAGHFEYVFDQPRENTSFQLRANNVVSQKYQLEVIPTPGLLSFEMHLDYPAYTGKTSAVVKGSGNTTVPEGTKITWSLETEETTNVGLQLRDTSINFNKKQQQFDLSHYFYNTTDYYIATSNHHLINYENLGYSIRVIKDQSPEIKVEEKIDSASINTKIYVGQISDDYGLSKLKLVYYKQGTDSLQQKNITIKKGTYDRFGYVFPNELLLKAGIPYEFYFEVTDNDAIHGGKVTKSHVFKYRKLADDELEQQQLTQQKENIGRIENSLKDAEEQEDKLKEINDINKQKNQLNYNDKKRIENFLERQKQQDEMMKRFHEDLKENLKDFKKENKQQSEYNELLQERLERQKKELEKNEDLMEKLKEISDKINKEELAERLAQMAKEQKKNNRSLEQILELTKRYYTAAKAEKIKEDLEKLADEQQKLSEKKEEENNLENQNELNKDFEKLEKDIEELEKQNDELQKPMDLGTDKKLEEEIKKEQAEATQKLAEKKKEAENTNQNKSESQAGQQAKQKQKNAARKMKEMSEKMGQMMQASAQNTLQEDSEMLRQILDNLVVFSFDQEAVMEKVQSYKENSSNLSVYLKKQNDLRTVFEHVDDSLFALSLRQPKISENINQNITDVYYNMDKTLELFAENRFYQGISHQQYTLTAANELADFLSNTLDNMQKSLASGSSSGSGNEFQLPDIIQSQQQLNKKMKEGMQKGEKGQKQGKENGKEGQEQQGESGSKKYGNEQMSGELYEIYKQQQQLRNALEEQLKKLQGAGEKKQAQQLISQMEQIENDLLEKGFTNATEQKMLQLQHQLLKMEDASFQQGKKEERESETNTKEFTNTSSYKIPNLQQYFNEVEILNRQALPLRQNYKQKVNAYFKNDD
ncbi:DUF4175 family protein [Galbibacter sp. PAP.153]|uniref:DUF4175 family protein n=1 Tax=Galbibacter sp. PAP.153 TaxID=3104623 RepID=UPI003009FD80